MARKFFSKKTIAVLLCACLLLVGGVEAFATTAESKRAEAQNQLDSVNSEISDIESQQSALQTEIDALDEELVMTLTNIDVLEEEIAAKEQELEEANTELEEARATEAEQYESMKERIVYMYVNGGDVSLFNALLGANSFADALNRVEMYDAVYDTDRELLQEYLDTTAAIEDLIIEIEEEELALEEEEAELEEQKTSLNSMIAVKSSQMDDFDSMLAEARSLAAQYKETIDEQTKIIDQEVAAQQAAQQAAQKAAQQAAQQKAQQSSSSSANNSSSGGSGSKANGVEAANSPTVSGGTGQQVADYACQFVGNPYVWGGESLTNGCDCSGFIKSVYAHFGVSLPHSSYSLRSVGYAVSASELQPGDIICYSGHCAIYIGGGQIVHASNSQPYPAGGIKIGSNYAYRTVVAIRRIF